MANHFHVAIFRNRVLRSTFKSAVISPVKVELTAGPLIFEIPGQYSRVHVIGDEEPFIQNGELNLPTGDSYLILKVKSSAPDLHEVENHLNRAITILSVVYQPQIFFECIYRGPIVGPKMVISAFCRPALPQCIEKGELEKLFGGVRGALAANPVLAARFDLMARFYARALDYDPGEEKFLMMWTCLEVHPMHQTSNIAPLKRLAANILGVSEREADSAIGIGRLYGVRSDLVHDGKLDPKMYEEVFRKLEFLVHEVMRSMMGLPYSGMLDRYFPDRAKCTP